MNLGCLTNTFPVLESENVVLKKIEASHGDDLFEIYDNERVFDFCGILPKHNRKTVHKMIEHFERDHNKMSRVKFGIFPKRDSEKLIGIIEIMDFKKKIDMVTVGYYLAEAFWGIGYATDALGTIVKFMFEELEMNRIHAEVMVENEASKKVLAKNGFLKEGTIRQGAFWPGKGIVDLEVYGILKADYENGRL